MGTTAARAEHLGHARTRGENRQRPVDDARAAGVAPASRRAGSRQVSAVAVPIVALKLPGWRSRTLLVLLLAGFLVLTGRAVYLQGLNNDFLQKKGNARYGRVIELSATRGMITDRNREPLAISTPVESVWASPADVKISPEQTAKLARLLG